MRDFSIKFFEDYYALVYLSKNTLKEVDVESVSQETSKFVNFLGQIEDKIKVGDFNFNKDERVLLINMGSQLVAYYKLQWNVSESLLSGKDLTKEFSEKILNVHNLLNSWLKN